MLLDIKDLQRKALENKKAHHFDYSSIEREFLRMHGEMAEAFEAYYRKKDDFGEELADVAIFLFGIAEITHVDLGYEILKKMEKNRNRVYKNVDGVEVRVSD